MGYAEHVVLVLAPTDRFHAIEAVVAMLTAAGMVVDRPRQLPVPDSLSRTYTELPLVGTVDAEKLREPMAALSQQLKVDLVLQMQHIRQTDYQLAVFDMDSTLIQCEVIDELAARHGVGREVAAITERAMRGEIDFNRSFSERLSMLSGLAESVIDDIAGELPLTDGVIELFNLLHSRGIYTAILSGGFQPFAERLQAQLGIDEVHANRLESADGLLTGRVVHPVVNGARKADLLIELAEKLQLDPAQIIAVGDGANDLPMLNRAGMGVAFHAKPLVREQADYHLCHVGIDGVGAMLGAPQVQMT